MNFNQIYCWTQPEEQKEPRFSFLIFFFVKQIFDSSIQNSFSSVFERRRRRRRRRRKTVNDIKSVCWMNCSSCDLLFCKRKKKRYEQKPRHEYICCRRVQLEKYRTDLRQIVGIVIFADAAVWRNIYRYIYMKVWDVWPQPCAPIYDMAQALVTRRGGQQTSHVPRSAAETTQLHTNRYSPGDFR